MLLAEASRVESTMQGALHRLQRFEGDETAAPETKQESTHTHAHTDKTHKASNIVSNYLSVDPFFVGC